MNLEKPTDSHTPDPANPQFGSGANGYPSALPQYTQLSQNFTLIGKSKRFGTAYFFG